MEKEKTRCQNWAHLDQCPLCCSELWKLSWANEVNKFDGWVLHKNIQPKSPQRSNQVGLHLWGKVCLFFQHAVPFLTWCSLSPMYSVVLFKADSSALFTQKSNKFKVFSGGLSHHDHLKIIAIVIHRPLGGEPTHTVITPDKLRHTHTRLTALCPGLPRWAGTREVKPIWILLKQETVSGSGISWAIRKSASRSRQITMPAHHHSVFYRPDALPATQPTASKHWRHILTN